MTASAHHPALVLLNAFPLDKEQWEPVLAALAAANAPIGDIMTFDAPGIGDMPPTDEPPSLDLIAAGAVAAMREVTRGRRALWVGCSMGGYVAMSVLDQHPDAVAGLGLLGTRAAADDPEALARRGAAAEAALANDGIADPDVSARGLLGGTSLDNAALVASVTANVARQRGVGVAWGQRAMAARPARLDVLRAARVPAFVARGEADAVTSDADADAMAAALGIETVRVAHIGHLVGMEAPEVVAGLIAELARAVREK